MRVLHVYRTYFPDPPGGIQEAIRQISLATSRCGIKSTVFCLSPMPKPAIIHTHNEMIVRSRSLIAPASSDIGGPAAFRTFARLSASHDVIHYHFPWPFADLLHLTIRPRTPAIMTYHSDIVRQSVLARSYAPLMWQMLTHMRALIATSPQYAASSAVLSDPRVKDLVRIIPLGLDIDRTAPVPRVASGATKPYLLFVGVPRYYKGLPTLIEAARQTCGRILIVGDGPDRNRLERMARASQIANVEFLGRVDEQKKRELLAGCRAFVLPSDQRSEAFGMALVEAAAFGKPMITCEIGTGTSFVNVNCETGIVVPSRNPEALANAMNWLLADPSLAARLGAAARGRYERLFALDTLGSAYRDLYESISDPSR